MLASTDARMCERGAWCLSALSPSLLDLTCSLCHIPPRRACPGTDVDNETMYSPSTCDNSACAEAISSIDDAVLFSMKTGFTVLPRPRRVLVVACTRSKRVYMRARSGVRQGRAKGVVLTQLGPPGTGLRRAARARRLSNCFAHLRSRHGMRTPREHRDADAPGAQHLRRRCATIDGS